MPRSQERQIYSSIFSLTSLGSLPIEALHERNSPELTIYLKDLTCNVSSHTSNIAIIEIKRKIHDYDPSPSVLNK